MPIVERIQYTGQRSLIGQVTDQGRQLLFLHLVGGYDMHASSQQLKSVVCRNLQVLRPESVVDTGAGSIDPADEFGVDGPRPPAAGTIWCG